MSNISCEIICVGTEILLGDIVNTNAQYISRGLSELGINVFFETVVGDNPQRLNEVLAIAKARAKIIITTGGLGPTYDDLTKETIATSFGKKLVMHEKYLRQIEDFFAGSHRVMTDNNKKQAMLPEDSLVLDNPHGTAPGCIIEDELGHIAIMMPGPPNEMKPMFDNLVRPYLQRFSHEQLVSQTIRVMTIGESATEAKLQDLMVKMTNPSIAPYAKEGDCIVRVTAKAPTRQAALELIKPVMAEIKQRLGQHAFGIDANSIEEYVVGRLAEDGKTLAILDCFTGGQICQRISAVNCHAQVLRLGITTPIGMSQTQLDNGIVLNAEKVRLLAKADYGCEISPADEESSHSHPPAEAATCCDVNDEKVRTWPIHITVTNGSDNRTAVVNCVKRKRSRANILAINTTLNMLREMLDNKPQ